MTNRFFQAGIIILVLILLGLSTERVTLTRDDTVLPLRKCYIAVEDSIMDEHSPIIQTGFFDALNDNSMGIEFVPVSLKYLMNPISCVLTIGEEALAETLGSDLDIPVLSCGVMDFSPFLGSEAIIDPPKAIEDHPGLFSGVSALPNMEITLSTIIESTPKLSSVGILLSSDDEDSKYQAQLLEKLMDEASIEWKEYECRLTNDPETDSAKVDAVTKRASRENSILYIPARSLLRDYVHEITQTALDLGIWTFGGDEYIGQGTIVSVFTDVYDQGYRTGKKAFDVLEKNATLDSLPLEYVPFTMMLKAFGPERAAELGLTFPKSFWDVGVLVYIYAPGSMTARFTE